MTIARLEQYRTIKRQIELYNKSDNISFLNAVDISKPSVQNNKISDTTADIAIKLCEEITEQEYAELCKEFHKLHKYIYNISNLLVREIAKLKFIEGKTFEEISADINYEPSSIQKKLSKYIKSH